MTDRNRWFEKERVPIQSAHSCSEEKAKANQDHVTANPHVSPTSHPPDIATHLELCNPVRVALENNILAEPWKPDLVPPVPGRNKASLLHTVTAPGSEILYCYFYLTITWSLALHKC